MAVRSCVFVDETVPNLDLSDQLLPVSDQQPDTGTSSPAVVSGFDLAWFGSLSSGCLCVFGLHGAVYILTVFCLNSSFYLSAS